MKKIILLFAVSSLFLFPGMALSQEKTSQEVQQEVAAKQADLVNRQNVWIDRLAFCESHMQDVTIVDSNGRLSIGWLQFQMGTWLAFGKSFGATRSNIHDFMLQQDVARSMLNRGMQNQWFYCSRTVTQKYGIYPTGQGAG